MSPGASLWPVLGVTESLLPPLLSVGSILMLLSQLSSSCSINMVGHTALRAWQSHPIPPFSLHCGKVSYFPGFVLPYDMVDDKDMVGNKAGDSSVMIRYQVDELTSIWLMYYFVA